MFKQLKFEYDVIQDSNRYITPPRLRLACIFATDMFYLRCSTKFSTKMNAETKFKSSRKKETKGVQG